MKRKPTPGFDRERAMAARPQRLPVIAAREEDDGKLRVTVYREAPRWARMFRSGAQVEQSFRLDTLGREVYEACDGRTDVRTLIRDFARRHKISPAEAELSVTTYLRTLTTKGLVGMVVERKEREP